MKKLFLFLFMLALVQLSYAQFKAASVDSVQIKSDTAYVQVTYNDSYEGSKVYEGVVGYQFTVVNYADTVELLIFEGTNSEATSPIYIPIDSLAEPLNGNYSFSQSPPEFKKYRIGIYGAAEDTATLKNNYYYDRRK